MAMNKETTFTKGNKRESSQKRSGRKEDKANPQEIFSNFARTTSKVVEKAALILEEEVAAGIIAAKQLEDQFVDSDKIRGEAKEKLMQRFRKDAHEVIDIMMDAVSVVSKYGMKVTDNLISMVEPGKQGTTAKGANTPILEMPQPIKAGENAEVVMALENNSKVETDPFTILTTDLLSGSGKKIPSSSVGINPKNIKIGPSQKLEVKVNVKVPKQTETGTYTGLLQATNLDNFKAILVVNVI